MSRRHLYLALGVVSALLVAVALGDLVLSRRRVIRLQAAWAYETQREQCDRLASERVRIAALEEMEAERCPAGSAEKQRHIRAAEFERSMAAAERRVAAEAGAMAKRLRLLARTSP